MFILVVFCFALCVLSDVQPLPGPSLRVPPQRHCQGPSGLLREESGSSAVGVPYVSPTWTIEPQSKREERHRNLLCPCTRDCPSFTSPHGPRAVTLNGVPCPGLWTKARGVLKKPKTSFC